MRIIHAYSSAHTFQFILRCLDLQCIMRKIRTHTSMFQLILRMVHWRSAYGTFSRFVHDLTLIRHIWVVYEQAFLLGNEGAGLTPREMGMCDWFSYIPQHGVGQSTNTAYSIPHPFGSASPPAQRVASLALEIEIRCSEKLGLRHVLLSDPCTSGAGGPNQNASRIQFKKKFKHYLIF